MKESNSLIDSIVEGIQDKKGRDITVVDLSKIDEAACRQFVICTGNSPLQVQAIAHSIGDVTREKANARPLAVSGLQNAVWVAMDFSEAIVHIFLPEERDFYDLEHLWADAPLKHIPNID